MSDTRNPLREIAEKYRADPVQFAIDMLGITPDPGQAAILNDYRLADPEVADLLGEEQVRGLSAKSGHGTGKSTTAAIIIWHNALCYLVQKTIVTAPTSSQLFDALYTEVSSLHARLSPELQSIFNIKKDEITHNASVDSLIIFRTARAETPEALAGKHSERIVIIVDEASGVPEPVYEALVGSMSGENAIQILIGNPTRLSGLFYDTHNKPSVMKEWKLHHLGPHNSPRMSKQYVKEIISRYGQESNAYRVRVLGEFPLTEAATYISRDLIASAIGRDIAVDRFVPVIWGLDPARFGDDRSVLAKRQGRVADEMPMVWRKLDTQQLAAAVKDEWDLTAVQKRPLAIIVDSVGVGAGVADRLRALGLPVRDFNISESKTINKKRFVDMRSYLFFKVKEWLSGQNVRLAEGLDSEDYDLVGELSTPTYDFQPGTDALIIENKRKIKSRGIASPDIADAFLLTFADEVSHLAAGDPGFADWNTPLSRDLPGIV